MTDVHKAAEVMMRAVRALSWEGSRSELFAADEAVTALLAALAAENVTSYDIAEHGLAALSKIAHGRPLTNDYERGIADGLTLAQHGPIPTPPTLAMSETPPCPTCGNCDPEVACDHPAAEKPTPDAMEVARQLCRDLALGGVTADRGATWFAQALVSYAGAHADRRVKVLESELTRAYQWVRAHVGKDFRDHACARCMEGYLGEIVCDGFVCTPHLAQDAPTPAPTTDGDETCRYCECAVVRDACPARTSRLGPLPCVPHKPTETPEEPTDD